VARPVFRYVAEATDANKVLIDVSGKRHRGRGRICEFGDSWHRLIEVLRDLIAPSMVPTPWLRRSICVLLCGNTPLPLLTYSGDAGNFHTYRNEVTAGISFINSTLLRLRPYRHGQQHSNSEFHNATYAGNFGWTPNATNDLRFTVRHLAVSGGQPNAITFYGIPDAVSRRSRTTTTRCLENQTRLRGTVRFATAAYVRTVSIRSSAPPGFQIPTAQEYFDGAPVTITEPMAIR